MDGLSQAGIELRRSGAADLVVVPVSSVADALALGAKMIVVEGRGVRPRLRTAGLRAESFLVRPRVDRPELLIPLADQRPAGYAIRHWSAGYTRRKRMRNRLARALVLHGRLPEIEPVVAVGTPKDACSLPYVVRAAQPYGVPADVGWFMTCGEGDALSRNVFQLFPHGEDDPAWALKFARLSGYDEPFRRDEIGLGLAERAGAVVAARAPRHLGRFTVDGVEASLETAAVGAKLRAVLLAPGSERPKMQLVEEVAAWLLAMARETAAPPPALRAELARLAEDVLPLWAGAGVTAALVRELPPVPAVLQHNDLGCWNVVVGPSGFTSVDWESAREHGLPLWDLVYFLTDALATLAGAASPGVQDELSVELLRGDSSRSPFLFGWVERAVRDLQIPREAVGPIVTLGWLHHGLSHRTRATALRRAGGGEPALPGPAGRLASIWLTDPALGVDWRAWRDA